MAVSKTATHPFNAFPAFSCQTREKIHKSQQNQKRNKTEETYLQLYDDALKFYIYQKML